MAIIYSNDKVILSNNTENDALNDEKHIKNVNVSKIETMQVKYTSNGEEYIAKISPRKIADLTRFAVANLLGLHGAEFSFLRPYLEKDIIWTFEADTAFTDGVRIFMSPIWGWQMLRHGKAIIKGGKYKDQYMKDHPTASTKSILDAEQLLILKYIQFTIIHECYHILYKHAKRAVFKNVNTKEEHKIANIAMDLEINRDIEGFFPLFDGCTETIGGIWYNNEKYYKNNKPFVSEAFEEIYDYFIENKENVGSPHKPNRTEDPKEILQQPKKYSNSYNKGWNDAIEAIKNKKFDPMKVDVGPAIHGVAPSI